MEDIENKQVTDYRSQLLGRMKERYPDRDFSGTEGAEGQISLEQSIIEAFDADGARLRDYEESTGRLKKLLGESPRVALFINTLASTQNASVAIRKAYGAKAQQAYEEGDASDLIAEIEAQDEKNRADDAAFEEEKKNNLNESFDKLEAWGKEKGLSNDELVDVFMRFNEILKDAQEGKYDTALFEMGWKADHYDEDVANARHEGEVAGRNESIKAQARKREMSAAMPPALKGQGENVREYRPEKGRSWSDFLK